MNVKQYSGEWCITLRPQRVFTWCALVLPALLLAVSCSNRPADETLRLHIAAKGLYSQGRFEECAAMLNTVNRFPPALTLRAKAEYFSNNYEQAESSCRRAIKLRPQSFEAQLYLARILEQRGNRSGAVQIVESLLSDNPQDIRLLRLASTLAFDDGKTADAGAFLDRAAELSAESAMVLLDRARLRWIAGRGTDALEDLSRARAMLPWETPLLKSIEHLESRIKEALQ